ncbi:hypothetical protein QWT69_13860 [Sporosarcina oncorhynchi]|uniref:Uncharacterized protein n=1 Tax=Sporosarcina oncorhynchi TaxID=3056444 RepID=A0ABZ0L6F2_9BACL|nr:hypothetical protein [Sporosarcina sp. T2O-4]WOV86944.1 hypothetical protein QWT69_13860 [Sporosarcina sp. T2O-4]
MKVKGFISILFVVLLSTGCSSSSMEVNEDHNSTKDFHETVDYEKFELITASTLTDLDWLDEKIAIKGMLNSTYFLTDDYGNIYFSIEDDTGSYEGFWYNTASSLKMYKDMQYAIENNIPVTVYGVFQENRKQVGHYNLFTHDVVFHKEEIVQNATSDEESIESEESASEHDLHTWIFEKVEESPDAGPAVTSENIEQFKPANLNMTASTNRDGRGQLTTATFTIRWDRIKDADHIYVFYDTYARSGPIEKELDKAKRVDGTETSYSFGTLPSRMEGANKFWAYIIVSKDGKLSEYSEVVTASY